MTVNEEKLQRLLSFLKREKISYELAEDWTTANLMIDIAESIKGMVEK